MFFFFFLFFIPPFRLEQALEESLVPAERAAKDIYSANVCDAMTILNVLLCIRSNSNHIPAFYMEIASRLT